MGLFALTSIPGARVLRFPLSQELSAAVEKSFAAQEKTFLSDIKEKVAFDGRYRPEQDEMLVIEGFEDVDGISEAVKNPLGIDPFDPKLHPFEKIKAIFSGYVEEDIPTILIQLFETRRVLSKEGIAMWFSKDTFEKLGDAGLTLDTRLLAILKGSELQFQSFHFVRRVFEMSEYYKEATADDIKKFAAHETFKLENAGQFEKQANTLVRKKIALILQSGILEKFTPKQLIATAATFKVAIEESEDGKIVLPEGGVALRRVLRFLDEDYYESPLTQTLFLSNSKRVAD